MIEAYPLHWPVGYKRSKNRTWSKFDQTAEKAQTFLRKELERMGASSIIVSSNVPVRKDGYFYSDMASTNIDDPGVAVYFKYRGKDISMCCDNYLKPWENIYALGKGIEALRGMERWGVSEFLDRAFTGFKAIAEEVESYVPDISWWNILGVLPQADVVQIKTAYKKLSMQYHPDKPGGNAEKFIQVKMAYEQAISLVTT